MEMEFKAVDPHEQNEIWKKILPDSVKKWAIFKYGTIVLCVEEEKDPKEHALEIMKEWGPVVPGTPLGDFNTREIESVPGWIALYAHNDIMNYVSPDDLDEMHHNPLSIGMYGRSKRNADFEALEIIHVE